ncbi:hypothetical protein Poli38472_012464 [Pythium oligandrum]|uniref:Uncharacterized protein n=1 Tax=Pythium oligandrum TaxID=41045 RepID=A0A8K1FR87_PYTOL|nr:hypothetical protein Poli38472_012464 [Pythium oligandrum]|eukprot:TMW67348.1 hypothetical protein Poli38472_012464 [Pythium oligandrum]
MAAERSLATRTLLLLPFAGLAAWSGNAALLRMQHDNQSVEFVVGSMDDTIADTLETGDIVLFQRKLSAMQPLAALHTWLLRQRFNPRYDHMGFIYVDRLGRKFVVEETLTQVQCRPYSARILTSESNEIVVLPLKKEHRDKHFQEKALHFVTSNMDRTSRVSVRQCVAALIDPQSYHPVDPNTPPLFPSAALVAEAYEALGLVDPEKLTRDTRVNKATLMPRHFVAKANGLVIRSEADAKFGNLLPIRLH